MNCIANVLQFLLALGLLAVAAVFVLFVLFVPWWLSVAGAVALVAAWPAQKRWQRQQDL